MSVATTGANAPLGTIEPSGPSLDNGEPAMPGFRPGRVKEYFEIEDGLDEEFDTSYGITVSIRQVIGAGIILGLGIVILNQVFTLNIMQNSSGPFNITTVTSPLGAALAILGLAIFVGGARIVMNQMGGGGGRGGL